MVFLTKEFTSCKIRFAISKLNSSRLYLTHKDQNLRTAPGGELSVTDLQNRLGIESSSVSSTCPFCVTRILLRAAKLDNRYYRVRDPEVFELLDVARRIFNNQLLVTRSTLEELEEENAENDQDIDVKRASPISVS